MPVQKTKRKKAALKKTVLKKSVKKKTVQKKKVVQKKLRKPAEVLPLWDLSHLVPAPHEDTLMRDLEALQQQALDFRRQFSGQMATLRGGELAFALTSYETLKSELSRLSAYASLDRQTRLNDADAGQLAQTVIEKANAISSALLFFTLDIARWPEDTMSGKYHHPTVARYRPWIEAVRAFRPHQMDEAIEVILHERAVTGTESWVRLYDETLASLRFKVGRHTLTQSDVFHQLSDPKPKVRATAAAAIGAVASAQAPTFGLILNTIVKDYEIDTRQRRFAKPVAARNLENQVEDDVVAALVQAVKDRYQHLSHRYYQLKAKWLGVRRLNTWDRNAPLPFAADREISWQEARAGVLAAYGEFHPKLAEIGARFFDEGWIDAQPRPGKEAGAFSAATVPQVHPYILMNYKCKIDDVMTLAHELGHGIHQVLAGQAQGYLMADTSLPLAETASVFGEMLTFQWLLRTETTAKGRRALIAGKVEDMLNTVVRQIAFHSFEEQLHAARAQEELTVDRIGALWMSVMQESLGPAFRFEAEYQHYWAYISHFFHVPFYVYAYAFGDCLVNALYAVYKDAPEGFADKYIALLSAGGSQRHAELLKPFGLNASDPNFWKKGLSVIEEFIDLLEKDF